MRSESSTSTGSERVAAPALPAPLEKALFSGTIPKLDGLRALAALTVVVYHYDPKIPFVSAGFGVLCFFVLSGFLITWLLLRENEKVGTVSLKKFYARRSLRIFPAFYCYWFFLTATLLLRDKAVPWAQAWSSFFYVANYYQGLHGYPSSGYSHTWSLGIEEQFYLLWPVIFLGLMRLPTRHRMSVLGGIIGFIWVGRATARLVFHIPEYYAYTAFEMRADSLLVGCLFAIALHGKHWLGLWRAMGRNGWAIFVTLGLLLGSQLLADVDASFYRDAIGHAVDPVLVALLIVQLLMAGNHPAARWLDSRPMRYIGTISYSTYLYQQIVLQRTKKILGGLGVGPVVQAVGTIGVVLLVAAVSYHAVEKPLLRFRSRLR